MSSRSHLRLLIALATVALTVVAVVSQPEKPQFNPGDEFAKTK